MKYVRGFLCIVGGIYLLISTALMLVLWNKNPDPQVIIRWAWFLVGCVVATAPYVFMDVVGVKLRRSGC